MASFTILFVLRFEVFEMFRNLEIDFSINPN